MAFCGADSLCAMNQDYYDCCSSRLIQLMYASTCLNNLLVISIDAILSALLLSNFISKIPSSNSASSPRFKPSSPLKTSSLAFNGCLGLVYLGLGLWMLEENLRKGKDFAPAHLWLVLLTQGLAWVLVGLVACIREYLKLLSSITTVFAGFLCVSSVLEIVLRKNISTKLVLDICSLPGATIFLISSFMQCDEAECRTVVVDGSLYRPLNRESADNVVGPDESVTLFAKAGLFSKLSFWWLNPLMKKGYERSLQENDIPRLSEKDRAETQYSSFIERLNEQKKSKQMGPSLILWTIVSCHWNDILISGFFALLKVLMISAGPVLLKSFINVSTGNEDFKYEGYALAFGLFLAKCLESLSQRQWYFRARRLGLQLRSLLTAAIFRKQLKLSNSAKLVHSSGEIMSYATVDAYRIGEFPFWLHQTWTTSLQLCIALIILYNSVGLATIAAMVVIVVTVACNAPLAKLQHRFQSKLMESQDERLKAMSEALVYMKVLKLYAWEAHFKNVIEGLREVECLWLRAFQLRRAYNSCLFWASPIFVSAATFTACYFLGIPLVAGNVFTFVATLRLVQDPVRQIPDVIGVVIQAKVAFTRIVKFLDAPELQSMHVRRRYCADIEDVITIKSANFSWDEHLTKPTLQNVNLVVKSGEKVAVCGEVGSGKSSLLAAILGEIPKIDGMVISFH